MANLLANPNLWNDGTNTPPAQWNGTAYVISDNNGRIYLAQAPVSGDTLQFTLSSNFSGDEIQYIDNAGGSSPVYSATSTPTAHTFTLPVNGATSRYIEGLNNSGGCAGMITIAPPAVPRPVASNVTQQVYEGSSANSVPVVVTVNGSPVSATLAVVTEPSAGTVHIDGSVMYYTPNPGYSGVDSFTYTGTYNGSTSAAATVSITVNAVAQTVTLSWSDDGGHTWSNRTIASAGFIGQTAQRVMFRRLGSTRRNTGLDRIFEISGDDYNQVALVGASINDG